MTLGHTLAILEALPGYLGTLLTCFVSAVANIPPAQCGITGSLATNAIDAIVYICHEDPIFSGDFDWISIFFHRCNTGPYL